VVSKPPRAPQRSSTCAAGRVGIPVLPVAGEVEPRNGLTPYLEIRNHYFLDCAERERLDAVLDVSETGS